MIKIQTILILLCCAYFINAQNGILKTYYFSGKVQARISYVDEIMEGITFYYYENGNLKEEKNYSNGKLNGATRSYYENGLLKEEIMINNGVLDGVSKSYYENGGLKEVKNYNNGKLLTTKNIEYDENYIAPLAEYEAGKKKSYVENNDFICDLEICPEPVGGIKEIEANIVYPKLAKQFQLEGPVLITAKITKKGIAENIRVIQGLGLGCSKAAINAVRKTSFVPGKNNGSEVAADVTFKLEFRIEEADDKTANLAQSNNTQITNKLNEAIENEKNFIICDVELCPKPIGGITELLNSLRYPPHAKRNNISGDVIIKTKVNELGFVISTEVIKGIGYGCDQAAVSAVIKTQFEPAKIGNKEVESIIEIAVPFILDKDKY